MTSTIGQIETHARALNPERLHELIGFSQRVARDVALAPPEMDPDYLILPLLKACLALSLEDKRKLNAALEKVIAHEESLGGAA